MENNTSSLAINEDVIAKMAQIAAMEVEGVEGLASGTFKINKIKKMIKTGTNTKGVYVSIDSGVINLDVYIKVKPGMPIKKIAEDVQLSVKEKIQSMTGNAVSSVNVTIADVAEAAVVEE